MKKARNLRAYMDILYSLILGDKSLNVLNLLAHLLYQHLQLDS